MLPTQTRLEITLNKETKLSRFATWRSQHIRCVIRATSSVKWIGPGTVIDFLKMQFAILFYWLVSSDLLRYCPQINATCLIRKGSQIIIVSQLPWGTFNTNQRSFNRNSPAYMTIRDSGVRTFYWTMNTIGTINDALYIWWSNEEPSVCSLDWVQNQLSGNGKLRKITI